MKVGYDCIRCLFERQYKRVREKSEPERTMYMKDVCRILSETAPDSPAPLLMPRFNSVFENYFDVEDKYTEIKRKSNEYLLNMESQLRDKIDQSDAPLLMALKLARAGNYIDFGALGDNVLADTLDSLLETAENDIIDMAEFERLTSELSTADKLTYIADNAGEIVLDKLFISELRKHYPKLSITLIARGFPVINDVTVEDCRQAGITEPVKLMSSGSHISGTYLPDLSLEAREILMDSDVIISKGQGNFETMSGCDLNVYYVFLCKCKLFCNLFNVPQLTGMFINERRANINF